VGGDGGHGGASRDDGQGCRVCLAPRASCPFCEHRPPSAGRDDDNLARTFVTRESTCSSTTPATSPATRASCPSPGSGSTAPTSCPTRSTCSSWAPGPRG